MRTNKELKIAAVVGALMIVICLIVVLVNTSPNTKADIKVYKNVEIEGQRGYLECSVPESILGEINTEFNKAKNLTTTDLAESHQIQGTYKIVSGKESIAFDDDDKNEIYDIDNKKLYSFKSTIYELVTTVCE